MLNQRIYIRFSFICFQVSTQSWAGRPNINILLKEFHIKPWIKAHITFTALKILFIETVCNRSKVTLEKFNAMLIRLKLCCQLSLIFISVLHVNAEEQDKLKSFLFGIRSDECHHCFSLKVQKICQKRVDYLYCRSPSQYYDIEKYDHKTNWLTSRSFTNGVVKVNEPRRASAFNMARAWISLRQVIQISSPGWFTWTSRNALSVRKGDKIRRAPSCKKNSDVKQHSKYDNELRRIEEKDDYVIEGLSVKDTLACKGILRVLFTASTKSLNFGGDDFFTLQGIQSVLLSALNTMDSQNTFYVTSIDVVENKENGNGRTQDVRRPVHRFSYFFTVTSAKEVRIAEIRKRLRDLRRSSKLKGVVMSLKVRRIRRNNNEWLIVVYSSIPHLPKADD